MVRLESGDKIPEQAALLIRGSKQSAPAVNLLDDLHLPRLATDGAILDEHLVLPTFFVDEQLHRFAAVGTGCLDDFGHRISGQGSLTTTVQERRAARTLEQR